MKQKDKDKTPEETWDDYLKKYGKEWDSLMEFLPPDAQEDLIFHYFFMSFAYIN